MMQYTQEEQLRIEAIADLLGHGWRLDKRQIIEKGLNGIFYFEIININNHYLNITARKEKDGFSFSAYIKDINSTHSKRFGKIGLNINRPLNVLARDIQRRLLTGLYEECEKFKNDRKKSANEAETKKLIFAAVARVVPIERPRHYSYGQFGHFKTSLAAGDVSQDSYNKFGLSLNGLSEEIFFRVLSVIADSDFNR